MGRPSHKEMKPRFSHAKTHSIFIDLCKFTELKLADKLTEKNESESVEAKE